MAQKVEHTIRGRKFVYEFSDKEPHPFAIDTEKTGTLYVVIKGRKKRIDENLKPSEWRKAIDGYFAEQDAIAVRNKTKNEENQKIIDKVNYSGLKP